MTPDEIVPRRISVSQLRQYTLDLMACQQHRPTPPINLSIPIGKIQSAFQLAPTKDRSVIAIVFDWS